MPVRIRFKNPPLVEVICGIEFQVHWDFREQHVARLWDEWRAEYPILEPRPPLPPSPGREMIEHRISNLPPLARFWLRSDGDEWLLQLQNNRFVSNWRKMGTHEYPGFSEAVYPRFDQKLERFRSAVDEENLGPIERPLKTEVTYVGQVPQGQLWQTPDEIHRVLPHLVAPDGEAVTKSLDNFVWTGGFKPDGLDGVLAVEAAIVRSVPDGDHALQMKITASGDACSWEAMPGWFDQAHDCCVGAFCELTDRDVQRDIWGRYDEPINCK